VNGPWGFHELQDVGVSVLDCEHKTPPDAGAGHPYVAIPSLVDGRLELTSVRRITDKQFSEWTRRTRPQGGDIIVTRRGRVGDSAVVPNGLQCAIGQNLVILRSDGELVAQRYLRWAARGPLWEREVNRLRNVGAVFDSLNVRDVARIRIPVPPLREQQAIAELLRALDDKIEADRLAVPLVQQLTDACFLQWRENLRDPELTTFGEVAVIHGGSTPKTGVAEYWGGEHAWAVPRDITALSAPYLFDTERHITDAGLASIGNRLHPPGSIFMTSRATIGAFAVLQRPCAANQGFIVAVPKDVVHRWFLFHEMRSRVDDMLDLANGSTFLEISRGNFKNMLTVLPSSAELEQLHELLDPLHGWCAALTHEAARLTSLRDSVLPGLLSGDLQIRDAEKLVGEAV
jgi:type I restriction enzyme S subunit